MTKAIYRKLAKAEMEGAEDMGVNSKTFSLIAISMVGESGRPKQSAESFAKYWESLGFKVADADAGWIGEGCGYGLVKGKKITSAASLMIAYKGRLTKAICAELSDVAFGS